MPDRVGSGEEAVNAAPPSDQSVTVPFGDAEATASVSKPGFLRRFARLLLVEAPIRVSVVIRHSASARMDLLEVIMMIVFLLLSQAFGQ